MKSFIKKLLRESLEESINLNLSKQLRGAQLKTKVNKELEGIFGKNIYRLYYDLETGKQITPTNKKPKLNFDIDVVDKLKSDVESLLNKFDFTLIDMDKNVAKNNKNSQNIKITKVLNDTDNIIYKQYTEYLSALSKSVEGDEKLYVVVSRHSHDIADMSSKPDISSCEDLSYYTDISQTQIGSGAGEGGGADARRGVCAAKSVPVFM